MQTRGTPDIEKILEAARELRQFDHPDVIVMTAAMERRLREMIPVQKGLTGFSPPNSEGIRYEVHDTEESAHWRALDLIRSGQRVTLLTDDND